MGAVQAEVSAAEVLGAVPEAEVLEAVPAAEILEAVPAEVLGAVPAEVSAVEVLGEVPMRDRCLSNKLRAALNRSQRADPTFLAASEP